MRATCRVRSRSTSAAGAVHVRVRAMACRSGTDGNMACCRLLVPPSGMLRRRYAGGDHDGAAVSHERTGDGVRGGRAPPGRPLPRERRGKPGFEGGRSIPLPDRNVSHWVGRGYTIDSVEYVPISVH